MRIVALGDFHLKEQELDLTERAMEDVAQCSPDLVIPLGDFGSSSLIGGTEGIRQAYEYLHRIGKPMRAILGNHDLQRESGGTGQPHGTMEKELTRLFQHAPYGVIEEEHYRLFFVSTEPQPEDSCYQVQECYVSDTQFNYIVQKLEERRGVPVVFFTHAPPIGCGLRTVPRVHVRATNAYLDQNHDPYRWLQLVQRFPEIAMWFSAHYHLSHGHPDSCTIKYGTAFFITGVHGTATRDSMRQSRVIDLDEHGIRVHTLDHEERKMIQAADWIWDGPLAKAIKTKHPQLVVDKTTSSSANESYSGSPLKCVASCSVGEDMPLSNGLVALDEQRWLVAAQDGYLWEVRPDLQAVMGTLHLGAPIRCLSVMEQHIWFTVNNQLYLSDANDIYRFMRNANAQPKESFTLQHPITSIAPDHDGGLWAASGHHLFHIVTDLAPRGSSHIREGRQVHRFDQEPQQLWFHEENLHIRTQDGSTYRLMNGDVQRCKSSLEKTDSLMEINGAVLTEENAQHPNSNYVTMAKWKGRKLLLDDKGQAYYWNVDDDHYYPIATSGRVIAACKAFSKLELAASVRFALVTDNHDVLLRPQLQIWEEV